MTEHIVSDHPGQIEIYTTDPHEPFVRFKSTRDDFDSLTDLVRRKQILRSVIGGIMVHVFPEHVTGVTFMPAKENN